MWFAFACSILDLFIVQVYFIYNTNWYRPDEFAFEVSTCFVGASPNHKCRSLGRCKCGWIKLWGGRSHHRPTDILHARSCNHQPFNPKFHFSGRFPHSLHDANRDAYMGLNNALFMPNIYYSLKDGSISGLESYIHLLLSYSGWSLFCWMHILRTFYAFLIMKMLLSYYYTLYHQS